MAISLTQYEKLEKLTKRAIENGWKVEGEFGYIRPNLDDELIVTFIYRHREFSRSAFSIIFDRAFAKALFGEQRPDPDALPETNWHPITTSGEIDDNIWSMGYLGPSCQYHLQQAVIADNPIDYMYKEVFGK